MMENQIDDGLLSENGKCEDELEVEGEIDFEEDLIEYKIDKVQITDFKEITQPPTIENGIDHDDGSREEANDSDGDGELKDSDTEGAAKKEDGALESSDGELLDDDDCEDGEIKEPGLKRSFVRPLCRFFSRGNCSWGPNCRFLHPGVNDKGNYSMISQPGSGARQALPGTSSWMPDRLTVNAGRPVEVKDSLPPPPAAENQPETAWERGLRHLKEMKKRQKEPGDPERKEDILEMPEPQVLKPPVVPPPLGPRDPYYDEPMRQPQVHKGYDDDPYMRHPIYPPMGLPPHMMPPPADAWMYQRPPFEYDMRWMRPQYPPHPEFYPPPGYPMPYQDPHLLDKSRRMSPPLRIDQVDKFGRTVEGGSSMPPGYEGAAPHPDSWKDPWARGKSPKKKSSSRSRSRHHSYSSFSSSSGSSKSRSGSKSSFSSSSSGSTSSSRSGLSSKSEGRERKVPTKPPNFNKSSFSNYKVNLPPVPGATGADGAPSIDGKPSSSMTGKPVTMLGKTNQLGSVAQSVVDAFKEGDDLDIFGRSSRPPLPMPSRSPLPPPVQVDFTRPPPTMQLSQMQTGQLYNRPNQLTASELLKANGEMLARERSSSRSSSSSSSSSGTSDRLYENIASPISSESSLSPDSEPSPPPTAFKFSDHRPRGMRPHMPGVYDPSMRSRRPYHPMMAPEMHRHPMPYRMVRPQYDPKMRPREHGMKSEVRVESREGEDEGRGREGRRHESSRAYPSYDRSDMREETGRPDYRGHDPYDHPGMQDRISSSHRGHNNRSLHYNNNESSQRREVDRMPSRQHRSSRQMGDGDKSRRDTRVHSSHRSSEYHRSTSRLHRGDEMGSSRKRSPPSSASSNYQSPPPSKHSRIASEHRERKTPSKMSMPKYSESRGQPYDRQRDVDMPSERPPPPAERLSPAPLAEAPKKKKGAASRREELLLQLKAVEDAIAKKKSKIQ